MGHEGMSSGHARVSVTEFPSKRRWIEINLGVHKENIAWKSQKSNQKPVRQLAVNIAVWKQSMPASRLRMVTS